MADTLEAAISHPMDTDLSIALRPIRPQDVPGARELIFGILRDYGLEPDPASTDADLDTPDDYYTSRGGAFWVMLNGQQIIATVGVLPHSKGVVELRKMYLHADYRGRQLGHRLLDHAIAWARERGFRRMTLETASVLAEATGLYRKCGFVETSEPTATARCDVTMARDL